MAKSKSRALEDRLSELPDSLILHIFELLPTIDVVRTTILSNRLKNLWTTIRCLTFDSRRFHTTDKLVGFVNGVIKFWRGNKIVKFIVDLTIEKSIFSDIDLWLRFAVENEVETLGLCFGYPHGEVKEEYWLPQYLYSCSSLKKLSVHSCNFEIIGKVQWDRLKSLEIIEWETGVGSNRLNENVLNQILLGSPQLELLELFVEETENSLSICSTSLKELVIYRIVMHYYVPLFDAELRIWTPNLKKLRILGVPHTRYLLKNVSSLSLATLEFEGTFHEEYHSCTWNDLLGERLREIFSAIQHVGKVKLSDWCIQVLGAPGGKSLLSPCPAIKILKLRGCLEEYEQILGLLPLFPNLRRLILEAQHSIEPARADHAENFPDLEFQTNSFLSQLRTVKVIWAKGDTSFLPLVEHVLKYASQLEKVVFREYVNLPKTYDKEVSSFCINGTADEHTKILTKLKS